MKINNINLALLSGCLLFCNVANAKDLVFTPTDPRYIGAHQVGCSVLPDPVLRSYGSFPGGLWKVTPGSSTCGNSQINQFLTYGPYTTEVTPGTNTATFTLMAGSSTSAAGSTLATLDAYCPTSNKTLASRNIDFGDFQNSHEPTDFSLNFDHPGAAQCPMTEFRIFWRGGAELFHVKTVVGSPKDLVIYPGDTPFVSYPGTIYEPSTYPDGLPPAVIKYHQRGCQGLDKKSWSSLPVAGSDACISAATGPFLTYGPYSSALGKGHHWATFSLNQAGPVKPSGFVEVYSLRSQRTLGSTSFSNQNTWAQNTNYDFTVEFDYDPDLDHGLEYRVFLTGGDLTHAKTVISRKAPNNVACSSDSMCRTAPVGCAFDYFMSRDHAYTYPLIARRDHSAVASTFGPVGGEGTPFPGSCANPAPFCVAGSCNAMPASASSSVVVDSNFYLDRAHFDMSANTRVTFNVDGSGKRNVVFAGGNQESNLRHTPYGIWAGSLDLPNVVQNGQTRTAANYFFKVTFDPATQWNANGSSERSLIWLQPMTKDGHFFNLQLWKDNNSNNVSVTVDACYFPGDTCNYDINKMTPKARTWIIPATGNGSLPTTVYLAIMSGKLVLLKADGSLLTGIPQGGQDSAIYYWNAMYDAPLASMDVTIINQQSVTLKDLTVSRNFLP